METRFLAAKILILLPPLPQDNSAKQDLFAVEKCSLVKEVNLEG